jgi:hypothetical protein
MANPEPASAREAAENAVVLPVADSLPSITGPTLCASDPPLTEDLALALLKKNDLPAETIENLSKNAGVGKSRKVKLAIVSHLKTPRYVSLALVRQLFIFDLMRVALASTVAGDIQRAAEDVLIHRMEAISSGETLSLARQASGRVAAALLTKQEPRILRAALENARLTDTLVIRALTRPDSSPELVHTVCHHPKWSLRREVRIALLRQEHTPTGRALEFSRSLPIPLLKEILQNSQLPANIKSLLLKKRLAGDTQLR